MAGLGHYPTFQAPIAAALNFQAALAFAINDKIQVGGRTVRSGELCSAQAVNLLGDQGRALRASGSLRNRFVRGAQPQFPIGLLTFAIPPFNGVQVGALVSLPKAIAA